MHNVNDNAHTIPSPTTWTETLGESETRVADTMYKSEGDITAETANEALELYVADPAVAPAFEKALLHDQTYTQELAPTTSGPDEEDEEDEEDVPQNTASPAGYGW